MVTLTQVAAEHVKKIKETNKDFADKILRVGVADGGCSGHTYQIGFDEERTGDHKFECFGVDMIVDNESLAIITGMEIDYVNQLSGSTFVFNNPNASKSCGCGSSFSA
jgi:iron-sulfur cluster assembly protein